VLNFFGLTDGKKDKKDRGDIVFFIALLENIP